MKAFPALLFGSVLALGCGTFVPAPPGLDGSVADSGTTGGGSPDAGLFVDAGLGLSDACPALNSARCDWLARCGLLDEPDGGVARCRQTFETTWCGPTTWPSHVASGALRYDAVRAAQCVLALATLRCDAYPALPELCSTFLRPRAQLGEACFDGFGECVEGVCRGATCPRTCQARAEAGEACLTDVECKAGLRCVSPLLGGARICTAAGLDGASCATDGDCATDFHCTNRTCRALPSAGQPCLAGRCASTAWCDLAQAQCAPRKALHEPCEPGQCDRGLLCDVTELRCIPEVAVSGGPCTLQQACPAGQFCSAAAGVDGVCTAVLDVDGACLDRAWCAPHLTCGAEADAGLSCQPRAGGGGACGTDADCTVDTACLGGRCVTLPLAGEDCAKTRRCRVGLCRDVVTDGGAICGSLLSAGQMCTSDAQCSSNLCNQGLCLARCVP